MIPNDVKPNAEQTVYCDLVIYTIFQEYHGKWLCTNTNKKRVSDMLLAQINPKSIHKHSYCAFAHCLHCQEDNRYSQQHPEEASNDGVNK